MKKHEVVEPSSQSKFELEEINRQEEESEKNIEKYLLVEKEKKIRVNNRVKKFFKLFPERKRST